MTDPMIVIRPAVESDLVAVLELFTAIAAEGQWIATELPINNDERLDRWRATLGSRDSRMFVALSGGIIVGHLGLRPRWSGLLELGMVVSSDHRGKGFGRRLLSAAIAWARENSAHKLALEVFPHNVAARTLYEKCGFIEEGYFRKHLRRRNGELWDSIPMGLLLTRQIVEHADAG